MTYLFKFFRDLFAAPEGYEDATGFHFGPEPEQTNADAEQKAA